MDEKIIGVCENCGYEVYEDEAYYFDEQDNKLYCSDCRKKRGRIYYRENDRSGTR